MQIEQTDSPVEPNGFVGSGVADDDVVILVLLCLCCERPSQCTIRRKTKEESLTFVFRLFVGYTSAVRKVLYYLKEHLMRRSKMTRLLIGTCALVLVGVWNLVAPLPAHAWGSPQPLPSIPDNVRRPRIAAEGNRFHAIFQKDDTQTLYYSRGIATTSGAVSWAQPVVLAGNVTADWDITADATGTVHVVYATGDDRLVYVTNPQRGDPGAWSSQQKIASLPRLLTGIEITLDSALVPYVAWGQGVTASNLMIAYRSASGWTVRNANNNIYLVRLPQIAVVGSGDGATIHVMYEIEFANRGSFYIGYTRGTRTGRLNNSNFSRSFFDPGVGNTPTITVDPSSGVLYTGFVAGSIEQGYAFQFTSSTNNGASWAELTPLALSDSLWADKTPLVADSGTVFMMLPAKRWNGDVITAAGFYDVRYNANQRVFSAPQAIRDVNGADNKNVSPDYALNGVAKVGLWITGFTENIFYNADPGGLPSQVNGKLVINGGAATTNNPLVTITIDNASGNPTSMRVVIDGDPTPSTPAQPFNGSFTLTLPPSNACVRTVAVQLANDFGVQSPILRASIVLDQAVQASAVVRNPYKRSNAVFPTSSSPVVDNGDDSYTREKLAYVEVNGAAECTGLTQLQIGRDASNLGAPFTVSNNTFAQVLPLLGDVPVGPNPVALQVVDALGNTLLTSQVLVYDPVLPVLTTPGTLAATVPTSGPNVLVALNFNGNVVSDNLYPGRGFWGVWIANSRTPSADPANDATLSWVTLPAPGGSADFTLPQWSVLSGIAPAAQTPGDYYIYVRFLDGAGNPTIGVLTTSVALAQIVKPSVELPIVVR